MLVLLLLSSCSPAGRSHAADETQLPRGAFSSFHYNRISRTCRGAKAAKSAQAAAAAAILENIASLPGQLQKVQTLRFTAEERNLPWLIDYRGDSRYKISSWFARAPVPRFPRLSQCSIRAWSPRAQCNRGTRTRKSGRERTISISGPCGSCSLDVADTFTRA